MEAPAGVRAYHLELEPGAARCAGLEHELLAARRDRPGAQPAPEADAAPHARHARRYMQNHSGAYPHRQLPRRDRRTDPRRAAVGEAERARRPGRTHANAETPVGPRAG